MISGCNRLICAASLAALVHIVGMPTARAGIVLTISDHINPDVIVYGTDIRATSGDILVGDFSVNVSARSNFGFSSGDFGFLTTLNSTIKYKGTTTGNLYITVSEAGFMLPSSTLPNFEYLNSSVVSNGGPGTNDGTAWFTSSLHQSGSGDVTTGIQNVNTTTNAVATLFQRTAVSYDLRNTTVVTLATGQGRDVSGSTSVTLAPQNGFTVQAVPEPASIVALLSSLPLVAAGLYLRRRKLVA